MGIYRLVAAAKIGVVKTSLDVLISKIQASGFDVQSIVLDSFLSELPLSVLLPVQKGENPFFENSIRLVAVVLDDIDHAGSLRNRRIPELASICFPHLNQEALTAALVCVSGLSLHTEAVYKMVQAPDMFDLDCLRQIHREMDLAFRNPDDYLMGSLDISHFSKIAAHMGRVLKGVVSQGGLSDIQNSFYGYLSGKESESELISQFSNAYATGNMASILDIDERHFLRLRNSSSGTNFLLSVCATFDGSLLAPGQGVRARYNVDNVILTCAEVADVFSSIAYMQKDLLAGDVANFVLLFAEKKFLNQNDLFWELSSDVLVKTLFYRDLCLLTLMAEPVEKLEAALDAIQNKYKLNLPSELRASFLSSDHDLFVQLVTDRLPAAICFKGEVFDPWMKILRGTRAEALDKYCNRGLVSFYDSIRYCKRQANIEPELFSENLLRYFDHLEDFLSGSCSGSMNAGSNGANC